MFQYCVWYSLHRDHLLYKLVGTLSNLLNTTYFHAHITLASRLSVHDAERIYKERCNMTKPWFSIVGTPYQTKTDQFYAVEQKCLMYGIKGLGDFHVSLAYRNNEEFTDKEVQQIAELVPVDCMYGHNLYLSLNDCRSTMPLHWRQLKRNEKE